MVFCGVQHLHPINVRVEILLTSGIVGSKKGTFSLANNVGMLATGGRRLKMILPWLNKWRITR
jgi:hypothetical protein